MVLSVEIEVSASVPTMRDMLFSEPNLTEPMYATRLDITLSDCRRVLMEGPAALSSVVSLEQGLIV